MTNKYLEAEKRLAERLGYIDVKESKAMTAQGALCGWKQGREYLPRWCRDWAACGPLIGEHELEIDCLFPKGYISVTYKLPGNEEYGEVFEELGRHPDKDTAVRYAIVMAVIAKLETSK